MKYATEKQINYLLKLDENLKREELENKTCREASYLIGCYVNGRIERNKASRSHEKALESIFSQDVTNEYLQIKNDDYYKKTTFGVLKFEDGLLLPFNKPHIETRFCFGYGYCGVSSMEDIKEASEMEQHARTNEDYFLKENLEQVDSRIKLLNEVLASENEVIGFHQNWRDKNIIYYNRYCKYNDKLVDKAYNHDYTNEVYRVATTEEVQQMLKAYQEVRASFEKRLHTYLKKYGLSKLKTWTYLSD